MEKRIHNSIALGAIVLCGYFYFFRFDDFSEEALIAASYLWLPLLIFVIVGRLMLMGKNKNAIRLGLATAFGLLAALASYLLMLVFFEVIWPGL